MRPVLLAALCFCLAAAGPVGAAEKRYLLFRDDAETLRKRAATEEGRKVMARLDELLPRDGQGFRYKPECAFPYTEGWWASGRVFRYLLRGDRADLDRSVDLARRAMKLEAAEWGGWGKAQQIAGTALAHNLAGTHWSAEFRAEVKQFLLKQMTVQRQGHPDCNYPIIFRAAGGMCALALLADDPANKEARAAADDVKNDLLRWAKGTLGDKGWRNGQWNGYADAMDIVLPFVIGYRNVLGEEALPATPFDGLPELYIMNGGRFHPEMGTCWGSLLMPLARGEHRAALRWMIDRYNEDPNVRERKDPPKYTYHARWPHHAILALAYAVEARPRDPCQTMPRSTVDAGIGGYILHADPKAAGGAAMATYCLELRGSTPPVMAGSFDLKALGATWVSGTRVSGIGEWHANTSRFDSRTHAAGAVLRLLVGEHELLPTKPAKVLQSEIGDNRMLVTASWDSFAYGRQRPAYFDTKTPHRLLGAVEAPLVHTRAFAADFSGRSGATALVVVIDEVAGADRLAKPLLAFTQYNIGGKHRVLTSIAKPAKQAKTDADWPLAHRDGVERRLLETPGIVMEKGDLPRLLALPDKPLVVAVSVHRKPSAATLRIANVLPESHLTLSPRDTARITSIDGGVVLVSGGARFFTILTVCDKQHPQIKVEGEGIGAKVTVGGLRISYDGKQIAIEEAAQ